MILPFFKLIDQLLQRYVNAHSWSWEQNPINPKSNVSFTEPTDTKHESWLKSSPAEMTLRINCNYWGWFFNLYKLSIRSQQLFYIQNWPPGHYSKDLWIDEWIEKNLWAKSCKIQVKDSHFFIYTSRNVEDESVVSCSCGATSLLWGKYAVCTSHIILWHLT